jgi:hypothetical protein
MIVSIALSLVIAALILGNLDNPIGWIILGITLFVRFG